MKKQTLIIFMLLFISSLTLSACGVAGLIEQPQASGDAAAAENQAVPEAVEPISDEVAVVEEQSEPEDSPAESEAPEDAPVEAQAESQAEPTPTEMVTDVATEVVAEDVDVPAPTPRADLDATPPGEVNLASGELQLVEFFAYW